MTATLETPTKANGSNGKVTTNGQTGVNGSNTFDLDGALEKIEFAFRGLTFEPKYKPNALKIFNLRYPRKDSDGNPTETPKETHWRVALNVASVTVLYAPGATRSKGDVKPSVVDLDALQMPFRTIGRQYNWMLSHGVRLKSFWDVVANGLDAWLERASLYYTKLLAPLMFTPNSPTWTGAGTPLGQMAACFVLPIEDSLISGPSSIMDTLRDAVAIQKTGGGNGFSFGRLRPSGSTVSTSMGQSTGVVGFLTAYNAVFEEIRQGGSRRGANMGVCPVWHPDLIKFVKSKVKEGVIKNFNISVGMTDRFMNAVESDGMWQFRFPGPDGEVATVEWEGEQVTEVPARALWDFITTNAHVIGDPGALFLDTANHFNPTPRWYELESTNPCGEQWLGPYENCCLGSIAVQQFVKDGVFDWAGYQEIIELSTQFLDDVVDANAYVDSVPQLEVAAQGGRRIGLGLMGLADALIMMKQRYGREDGLDLASQITEFMRFHALLASSQRAAGRGAFYRITESVYDAKLINQYGWGSRYTGKREGLNAGFEGWLFDTPKPFVRHERNYGRPELNWDEVKTAILEHGVRNSCQVTFAPTGTIASTAGVEGYGCEPLFALTYTRTVMQEAEHVTLDYPSGLFAELLDRAGVSEADQARIGALVKANNGSCQGIDLVPEHIRDFMVVAADLSGREHVLMQAALQAFVDNSMSKTTNFPKSATIADVAEAYLLAWQTGCKGITIYRQGSREEEVLSTSQPAAATGAVEVVDADHWPFVRPLPIPREAEEAGLLSRTWPVRTPFGKMRCTVTYLDGHEGRPFDVSLSVGRGGNDINAFAEALARVASVGLRSGVPVLEIADQLIGIGGLTQERTLRPDRALSVADAFGKLLRRIHDEAELAAEAKAAGVSIDQIAMPEPVKVHDPKVICPECRKATVVMVQGCKTCSPELGGCAWSQC